MVSSVVLLQYVECLFVIAPYLLYSNVAGQSFSHLVVVSSQLYFLIIMINHSEVDRVCLLQWGIKNKLHIALWAIN